MFKKKIVLQLTAGFVLIVIISLLTLGLTFIQIFRQYELNSRQETMLAKARSISEVISANLQNSGQMRGIGGFMRFLDAMAEANVWILDRQGNPMFLPGMGIGQNHAFYSDQLPEEARKAIADVLNGKESISQNFSSVYQETTLTVGVPIVDAGKNVAGLVLLHSPVYGISDTLTKTANILLLSLIIGLGIAVGSGSFIPVIFTRPLKIMNNTALEMARGNYTVRTGIKRQDEIGQLGSSLDFLASVLADSMEKINKMEQVRRDFVANVSHEFRTPLTVIRGSLKPYPTAP
jgi:two-component system sensor histidine kinase ResE